MQGVSSVEGTLFSFERKKPPCKFIWEERRMKKFWIVLLSLLLSLGCVVGFAACDETPPNDETGGIVQPGRPFDFAVPIAFSVLSLKIERLTPL